MANNLNMELRDKIVILDKEIYLGKNDIDRMFYCGGGFGCNPHTNGNAIFGHFVMDGEEIRAEGYHVKRLATPEEIQQGKYPQELTDKQRAEFNLKRLEKQRDDIEEQIKQWKRRKEGCEEQIQEQCTKINTIIKQQWEKKKEG